MFVTLLAAVPAAAVEPRVDAEDWRYVAGDAVPKTVKLDPKQVCENGYVDPKKLAVQLMVQLEMFDELQIHSAAESLRNFDGSTCRSDAEEREAQKAGETSSELARRRGYCTGTIVIQRMILNVYAGYAPRPVKSLADFGPALDPDVDRLPKEAQRAVVAFQRRFMRLDPSGEPAFVQCDYARKAKPDEATPGLPPDDGMELVRSTPGSAASSSAHYVATAIKALQFRRYPTNLVYRGAADSDEKADPTYLAGRDLYASDAGFSISFSRDIDRDKDSDKRSRALTGAIGLPLCGIAQHLGEPRDKFFGGLSDDCHFGGHVDGNAAMPWRRSYNIMLYAARDWSYEKKSAIGGAPDEPTADPNLREAGAVGFLYTDDLPYGSFCYRSIFSNCAHYFVGRAFELKDENDGSLLHGLSLRYIPVFKTKRTGLGLDSTDLCLNSVCGDPDRIIRVGVLADARLDFGDYRKVGDVTKGHPERRVDFTRVGGRLGLLTTINLVPDLPISGWSAYTYLRPLNGYDKELGQWQSQASISFGAATLSVSWIRGEREDTAANEDTFSLSLGFKTK